MKTKNFTESFGHALDGLLHCIRHERNIRIHFVTGCIVFILALVLSMRIVHMMILVLVIAMVIICEMINTAIENVIDLVSPEYHPLAKIVKDITAGAVLFASIAAVIVGCLLFIPYLWALI